MGLDDPSPRFSWQLDDSRRGARQTAYRILVAPSVQDLQRDQGTLWDTGKQDSARSVFVAYRGAPLRSKQRCYWKVRVWDQHGLPTGWSEPSMFEMGIMDVSEWQARWIGLRQGLDEFAMGPWVWHPTDTGAAATIYLRTVFAVRADSKIAEARLYATADNGATLFVNNERLGSSQDWKTLSTWDVTGKLGPGANVVAAEATNADGPAAFVAGLLIRYEDGQTQAITTSEGWRTAADAEGEWATAGYDDSAWVPPVVVAQWGAAPYGTPGQGGGGRNLRSQCFRKEFRLDQPVTSARAYVSGLGLYELRINGRKVGADELAPGWTLYDKRVQYQTFDVTDLLRSGRNAVGAVVGNGWWSGRISWRTPPPSVRNVLRFVCELDVQLANGGHVIVATDDSWRAHESPVLSDDLYDGETYDARLAMPGWDQPGFDDREWRPTAIIADDIGRLVAQRGPAIRCTHALAPKAITEPSPGVFVFDFGQNMAGRERLKVRGPAGTAVRIRFAEVLNPDGSIYTENYRSAKATDNYILRGDGEETWAPRFTYRGFRYAEMTGFPGRPGPAALTAEAVHSDAPVIGRFECSEPLLNQIQHNIVWGQRSNMHSVPTDCPQRDERLGWTGDAQAFAPTACWNM
ncbi:MAG TPA: family 78 glycoside hydrolase catalytic domain, partial [Armatimonadota bacterium]|nr:family 78 glycoside hydrolase catalytic domain [Armatimonadota bacterium]